MTARKLGQLTEREIAVVKLIAEGKNSHVIAAELGVSVKTVDRHRHNALHRLGCLGQPSLRLRGDVMLTRYAIREGWVTP